MRRIVEVLAHVTGMLLVFYVWGFGLYASHTQDRFVLAVFIPPVAWFDSIYYWFAPADWERKWDANVEALTYLVFVDEEKRVTLGPQLFEAEQELREWLSVVPQRERDHLEQKFRVFVDVTVDYITESIIAGISGLDPPPDPIATVAFENEPGLVRSWHRNKKGLEIGISTRFLSADWRDKKQLRPRNQLDPGEIVVLKRTIKDVMNARLDLWFE